MDATRIGILGPQGSGKGLLVNILACSPELPQPGSVRMHTAPARKLMVADSYILMIRERAVDSIFRHHASLSRDEAESRVAEAWSQIRSHVVGAPVLEVRYRDVVEDLPSVIRSVASWAGIDTWEYVGREIFDGDLGFDG